MQQIKEQRLTGERALFHSNDLEVSYCIFADGESPLKESSNIRVEQSSFQWKYPFWYCSDIVAVDCTFAEMARAGIWYGKNIALKDCLYEAPKGFRRIEGLKLENVSIPNAKETLWDCKDVVLSDISVNGNYFAMNCEDITIDGLQMAGNYCFDGCRNVTVRNAKMLSKDAFWNCDNVTVENSHITGEYLGWNSQNVTLVDCTIESLQGMCYMKNLTVKNCRFLNTTLAFEYSTVDVESVSLIDSVINPAGGTIRAKSIGELIMDKSKIDPSKTTIITEV